MSTFLQNGALDAWGVHSYHLAIRRSLDFNEAVRLDSTMAEEDVLNFISYHVCYLSYCHRCIKQCYCTSLIFLISCHGRVWWFLPVCCGWYNLYGFFHGLAGHWYRMSSPCAPGDQLDSSGNPSTCQTHLVCKLLFWILLRLFVQCHLVFFFEPPVTILEEQGVSMTES